MRPRIGDRGAMERPLVMDVVQRQLAMGLKEVLDHVADGKTCVQRVARCCNWCRSRYVFASRAPCSRGTGGCPSDTRV